MIVAYPDSAADFTQALFSAEDVQTGGWGTLAAMGAAGLFGPGTMTWKINREGVLLLGGGRALILQVAHPLVAAGVAEFSNYREDPWGRLYRTLDTTTAIVFGDSETSAEASARLERMHSRVRGTTNEPGGRFPAGTPYEANDPELLMWVHATLVDTSLLVYDRYVARLSIEQRRRYYEEQKLLGEAFGVPIERQPATYADFNDYVEDMLSGDSIAATAALRDVVDATLNPSMPFVARPLVEAIKLATAGMLPPRLRADLGLAWGPNRERLFGASRVMLRGALPLLPRLLREFPPARSADRRVRVEAAA
jgi:uncharacterized protein (DUF2236 family)